jgi:hypothetical protein
VGRGRPGVGTLVNLFLGADDALLLGDGAGLKMRLAVVLSLGRGEGDHVTNLERIVLCPVTTAAQL